MSHLPLVTAARLTTEAGSREQLIRAAHGLLEDRAIGHRDPTAERAVRAAVKQLRGRTR